MIKTLFCRILVSMECYWSKFLWCPGLALQCLRKMRKKRRAKVEPWCWVTCDLSSISSCGSETRFWSASHLDRACWRSRFFSSWLDICCSETPSPAPGSAGGCKRYGNAWVRNHTSLLKERKNERTGQQQLHTLTRFSWAYLMPMMFVW